MKIKSLLSSFFLLAIICTVSFSCTKESGTPDPDSITILDNSFSPSPLTVDKGTTVTWTNSGASQHTVTSNTGSELGSPTINSGGTYVHTFNTAGTFDYHCTFHGSPSAGMRGTVIVNP